MAFDWLRDFFEYGPLGADDVALLKARADKRARARARAAALRAARVAEAESELGLVDRLFGVTGEDVVRNRDRRAAAERRALREAWRDEHLHELEAEYARARRSFRWWDDPDDAHRQAKRRAYSVVRSRYR